MRLETGKLDSEVLKKLVFDKLKYKNNDVKVRPGIGEDCAVIGFGKYDCIMSTDPISSAISDIGSLAIHITCNDIASNGVKPLGIMLAVMLPVGTTQGDIAHIMKQASDTASALEVEIIGGHTEVSPAVNQPVIVSTAIGKTLNDDYQRGDEIIEGDYVVMTKSAGLEGCGIIASDYEGKLSGIMTSEEINTAKSFLKKVSVVKEGVIAGKVGTHGMHDITEGGILGAVWEVCHNSDKGVILFQEEIPVSSEAKKITDYFEIDPLRLISSGSMLIIVPHMKLKVMKDEMSKEGIDFSVIGEIMNKDEGMKIIHNGEEKEIIPPYADELYKVVGKVAE